MASPRRVASAPGGAVTERSLVTPSAGEAGWRRPIQLFASSPADPRARHPTNGPPVFPPGTLAMTTAVLAVFAPYVTLPFRRYGRALIAAEMIGGL
jgi:hypothetical protein